MEIRGRRIMQQVYYECVPQYCIVPSVMDSGIRLRNGGWELVSRSQIYLLLAPWRGAYKQRSNNQS